MNNEERKNEADVLDQTRLRPLVMQTTVFFTVLY